MIDRNTLNKIAKVDDKDIIKDILSANGYTNPMLQITEHVDGKIQRISISYTTGDKKNEAILRRDGDSFSEITNQGVKKTLDDNPIQEPKGIIKTDTYVGDSTKLYGDEIDTQMGKDERGKPVKRSFMETHGERIARIMWEIANQKADPHIHLTAEQQRKLEENLKGRRLR